MQVFYTPLSNITYVDMKVIDILDFKLKQSEIRAFLAPGYNKKHSKDKKLARNHI